MKHELNLLWLIVSDPEARGSCHDSRFLQPGERKVHVIEQGGELEAEVASQPANEGQPSRSMVRIVSWLGWCTPGERVEPGDGVLDMTRSARGADEFHITPVLRGEHMRGFVKQDRPARLIGCGTRRANRATGVEQEDATRALS